MQQSRAYYKALLSGFIQERITQEQVRELYAFIRQQPDVYEQIMNEPEIMALVAEKAEASPTVMKATSDQQIREGLLAQAALHETNSLDFSSPRPVATIYSRYRNWWWAAAILVIGITTAVTVTLNRKHSATQFVADTQPSDVNAPKINRATITIAGGGTLSLDSLDKGLLAQQGNIRLVKLADGQIVYQDASTGKTVEAPQYNTLNNPYGSRVVDVTLSDGSRVWLNAGSSLTYPVSFTGSERKVAVNGEAYFEVAHNASKPFYVTKGTMEIKVLGTRFNVNAYDDEQNMKITLLEGSVRLTQHAQSLTLSPGQQAIAGEGELQTADHVNLDAVMAWKNGWFNFSQVQLQEVMRQLARWYDVEVEYQGDIAARKFSGEIQRELSLSEVLEGLQDMGLHFKITGKKLLITP